MINKCKRFLVIVLGLAIFAGAAEAALQAVDPGPYTAATGFFPLYYTDGGSTNPPLAPVTLDLCLSKAAGPNGQLCALLPNPGVFDPDRPIVFPVNFPDEAFYFMADAIVNGSGMSLTYGAHLEAAFLSGLPAPGDQITFARIRVRADFDLTVPTPGTYTVTHPYGVETFNIPTPGRRVINLTRDIGIAPLFTGALAGDIGPFLRRSATAGGEELVPRITAVNPDTGLPEEFIGDPNVPQFATGSPFGTNFVQIQRTADGGGNPTTDPTASSDQFFLQGRVWNGQRPTNVAVERASYGRTPGGAVTIDAFANTPESTTATVCFRETLDLVGGTEPCLFTMTSDGAGKFYGRDPAAPAVPPYIVVTGRNPSAVPATTPTPIAQALSDVVKVTRARFARDTNTLVIQARSSDQAFPPKITALGLGVLTPGACPTGLQRLETVLPGEPPAFVTLVSSGGGRQTEPVTVVPTAAAGGANTAPVAANDTATTTEDTPVTIAVLANDTDADCDALSVTGVSNAVNGTAVVNANGTVTFTPALNFNGTGTAGFAYDISDGNGGTAGASVTVTVTPVNDAPVANPDGVAPDFITTTEDTPLTIQHATLLANDTDVDNAQSTLAIANFNVQGLAGTLSLGLDNVTFTPNLNFNGTTSFSYRVQDPSGALSSFATVAITVAAVNDAPVANNDTANTASGTPVTINVLANDTDVDNAPPAAPNAGLTVSAVTQPLNGTVVINSGVTPNTVTYTPAPNFSGSNTFTYTASDPGGLTATATVAVTVAAGPAVDLDIDRFTVPGSVRRPATITPQLRVRNNGTVNQPRNAQIRGVTQTGAVFYDRTIPVSDPVGGGTTTFNFPASQSTNAAGAGTITWTAEIFDDNPDVDRATATTQVR